MAGKNTGGKGIKGLTAKSVWLLVLGLLMVGVSVWLLLDIFLDYKKSDDTYADLVDNYVKIEGEIEAVEDTEVTGSDDWWYQNVSIYLDELQKINPDIVGWIRFDNIDIINYPILYSGDDTTYLRTDIYGQSTTAGCIFLEGLNQPDFEDYHTIIYGHNMKNSSMFGMLSQYKTEGFYEGHEYFTIYTNEMAYRYEIFAYQDVPETDDVYSIGFAPDDTWQQFIYDMRKGSYIDPDIAVTKNDKVVTLSTCSNEGERFVVHAVRIDQHVY